MFKKIIILLSLLFSFTNIVNADATITVTGTALSSNEDPIEVDNNFIITDINGTIHYFNVNVNAGNNNNEIAESIKLAIPNDYSNLVFVLDNVVTITAPIASIDVSKLQLAINNVNSNNDTILTVVNILNDSEDSNVNTNTSTFL
ncbi:hypothetical protein HOG27_05235 [bacterium]|jgi:hypothetical protein|nr:hypothetical protein [bacterium]